MNVQIATGAPQGASAREPEDARPTLVSLARELGVSRQTVSNVINAPDLVKRETRERVEAAIASSGYRPSALGRGLRTSRSMAIGLRVHSRTDDINGTVMDRFLHALTDAAQEASYRVTLFTAPDDRAELVEIRSLRSINGIDGCVLTDTRDADDRPARLRAAGCPVVAFGRPWGELPGAHSWVDVDGSAGTRAATRALLDRGHTRIGFIGWRRGSGTGDDRRAGWRDAMTGPATDLDALSIEAEDGVPFGREAALELQRRGATAVVCSSDSLALGAFGVYADAADAFVPVIGFDNTPLARALSLSSVAQPVEEAARFCVRSLIVQFKQPDAPARQRLLEPTLALRSRLTT